MFWSSTFSDKVQVFLLFLLLQPALNEVCVTPACNETASYIFNTIDMSIDPCHDFYKFACGGLFKKPLGTPLSLVVLVEEEVSYQIKTMLEEPSHISEPKAVQSLKHFFKSCMDESAIEKSGLGPIEAVLDQLGGWPVIAGSRWQGLSLEDLIIRLRRLGLDFSQLLYFSTSSREPDKILVALPVTSLVKRKNKRRFHQFITDMAVLLRADTFRALTELREVIDFEMHLYRIAYKKLKSYKVTLKYVQENFALWDWMKLLNNIYPKRTFSLDDQAYFPPKKYLLDLTNLLQQTSNRTVANYVIWKALEGVIPYLPKAFRDLKINYDAAFSKQFAEEERNRFNVCKWISMMILPPTFETLYMKNHFRIEKKHKIKEITSVIKHEFMDLLNTTDMYDEVDRKRALLKATSIIYVLGGPAELFDEERLREVFDSNDVILSRDCLTNALALNRHRYKHELTANTTLNDFYSLYMAVNAYYVAFTKSLVIPAAIMQSLYFNEQRPQYLNFGTLGMLIAHELTHAFSKNANDIDKSWTKFTEKRFQEKGKCVIKQISRFEIEGSNLHMDGIKTLEETICDLNGAEVAYRSYQNWVRIHGEEEQLPGLNYTPNQLFWISSANFFCDIIAPNKLKQVIDEDPHPLPEFRIFGTMSNSKQFAKDFNCYPGSRMNPSKKCLIF